jgi:hypothetical protein
MKVASVCPACGRPASTKGRSECLYCGVRLLPVETGVVKAAGSGAPIAVDERRLKVAPPAERPEPPRLDAPWLRQTEPVSPARLFFRSAWTRFLLIGALLLLSILGLGKLIEDHQPGNAPARGTR